MGPILFQSTGQITASDSILTQGSHAYALLGVDSESGHLDLKSYSTDLGANDTGTTWHIDTWNNSFRVVRIYRTSTSDAWSADTPFYITKDNILSSTGAVYAAIWNDIADFITVPAEDIIEPGYCYTMDKNGHYSKTSKYMQQNFIGLDSDTYGFKIGDNPTGITENKLHSAVAGYVLAYVDKKYSVGTPLTCTENGYLTEISKEDKANHPEMVLATYWKTENNEFWGSDDRKIQVNGRHWVKIK